MIYDILLAYYEVSMMCHGDIGDGGVNLNTDKLPSCEVIDMI